MLSLLRIVEFQMFGYLKPTDRSFMNIWKIILSPAKMQKDHNMRFGKLCGDIKDSRAQSRRKMVVIINLEKQKSSPASP